MSGDLVHRQFELLLSLSEIDNKQNCWQILSSFVTPFLKDNTWQSYCAKDGSPLEWSLTFNQNQHIVRLVFEPSPELPNIESVREASCIYLDFLRKKQIHLLQLEKILHIILPSTLHGPGGLWFGIDFQEKFPLFKAYGSLCHLDMPPEKTASLVFSHLNMADALDNFVSKLKNTHIAYNAEGVSIDLIPHSWRLKVRFFQLFWQI